MISACSAGLTGVIPHTNRKQACIINFVLIMFHSQWKLWWLTFYPFIYLQYSSISTSGVANYLRQQSTITTRWFISMSVPVSISIKMLIMLHFNSTNSYLYKHRPFPLQRPRARVCNPNYPWRPAQPLPLAGLWRHLRGRTSKHCGGAANHRHHEPVEPHQLLSGSRQPLCGHNLLKTMQI